MSSIKNKNALLQDRWQDVMQNNYGTPDLAVSKGRGNYLFGVDGRNYLDLIGGIATNIIGHSHRNVVKAISKQAKTLDHTSNLYIHDAGLKLAEKLRELTGSEEVQVFFANSGAEVNEAAFKIARLTGKERVIATSGGFHGRTIGALSLTGQNAKREPFKPLLKKIDFVPFNDLTALEFQLIENNKNTAAFIVEPIQGENGVVVPSDGYLANARKLTEKYGALLIIDSVQTGMGRTGTWFGYESEKITPDVVTLAKGLGGGLPMGAMLVFPSVKNKFTPGSHGSTFGGNPICSAAALATIKEIENHQYLHWAIQMENKIKSQIGKISGISQVRGKGLLIGIGFEHPIAKKIQSKLRYEGILVGVSNDYLIRIAPPLTIKNKEIDRFALTLQQILARESKLSNLKVNANA